VRAEGQADHQGREEVFKVARERSLFVRHAEEP
jgi:hypothetical protein